MPIVKPPMKPPMTAPEPPAEVTVLSPRTPRTAQEMALKASEHTDASLEALGRIIENPESNQMAIIAAARELLSRAHGTPAVAETTRKLDESIGRGMIEYCQKKAPELFIQAIDEDGNNS